MQTSMIIDGVNIEVVKKKIKNMRLTVSPPSGHVRLSAPLYTSDEVIRLFASNNMRWIKKQIKKFQVQPWPILPEYVTGEIHHLWGHSYQLQIEHTETTSNVRLESHRLIITVRADSTREQRKKVLNEWYRAQLKTRLPALFAKWERIIGVKASFVGVKNMRTRWGSCNVQKKRIWVNLQLAQKPFPCLEYVVVHELVHLLEKGHGLAFMAYMDKFLPDWRVLKDELNSF